LIYIGFISAQNKNSILEYSKYHKKNIFCIEGSWDYNLKNKRSIKAALEFLELNSGIKSIRKDCSTISQFNSLLSTSLQKTYKEYGIIYLSFHGKPGLLKVEKRKKFSLDMISGFLEGKAKDKIIHFGSCSTLDLPPRELRAFWHETGALAISGYTKDIDFIDSTILDILYFRICQNYKKIPLIERDMHLYYRKLIRELGFKMIYQK
jgi:hypothetical protein